MQQTTEHETFVQETMLEQLQASKIHGFNFFAYTGIRSYTMAGEDTLILKTPRGSKYDSVHVILTPMDEYDLIFFKGGFPKEAVRGIYCDMFAEIITRNLGVYWMAIITYKTETNPIAHFSSLGTIDETRSTFKNIMDGVKYEIISESEV